MMKDFEEETGIPAREATLPAEEAMAWGAKLVVAPPRGTEILAVQCLEGALKSADTYYFRVAGEARTTKGREQGVEHFDAYDAGIEAGENIGLHIQVGGAPDSNKLS